MNFSTLLECEFSECKKTFQPTNKRQRFCSTKCRAAAKYLPTKLRNREQKLIRFRERNRARALGFDARYGGPRNSSSLGTNVERSRREIQPAHV
jgi:hypothetical protein